MPVNTYELVQAISIVTDNANVRVAMKKSAKGAIVCGVICFLVGLLLGPIGLAIGGIIGGLMAYKITKGTFVPVSQILMNELTEDQTEQLVRHVNAAVADVGLADLALLIPLLATQADIQAKVLQAVTSFLINEMRMSIVD